VFVLELLDLELRHILFDVLNVDRSKEFIIDIIIKFKLIE